MDTPQSPATPPTKGSETASKKKIVLLALAFIVFASALVLLSYLDASRRDLDREPDYLEADVAELADRPRPPLQEAGTAGAADGKMRPPTPEGWTVAEGDGYLIDLPPGFALRRGENGFDAVHSDPLREDDLAPYAVIRKLPASQEAEYAGLDGRLLIVGEDMYWMHLYENLEWKEFDQAAASLRVK